MPTLSDANLSLLLQELVNRPTLATVNASANPSVLKALWTTLTFYQWVPSVRSSINAAIQAAMHVPGLTSHAAAIAQTRDALLADPDFYPFCLSAQYWPDAQRAHFRGLVGQTTYQPPSYFGALASDAMKILIPTLAGTVVAAFLPEELIGGMVTLAATKVAGRALSSTAMSFVAKMATGTGLAAGGSAVASTFNGKSSADAERDREMWRRYQIEARRRRTP